MHSNFHEHCDIFLLNTVHHLEEDFAGSLSGTAVYGLKLRLNYMYAQTFRIYELRRGLQSSFTGQSEQPQFRTGEFLHSAMSAGRSNGKLLHWTKKGDMILKNKVKEAILRENTYEERSLHTTLDYLDKHKTQKEKHMINKQLQFATIKHRTLEKNNHFKPCLGRVRSWTDGVLEDSELQNFDEGGLKLDHQNSIGKQFNATLKWKKAISVVRLAVQSTSKNTRRRQLKEKQVSFLPPLAASRREEILHKRLRTSSNHTSDLALPAINKDEKHNRNCLEDPRFLKLQQILSQGKEKREKRSENPTVSAHGRPRSFTYL